MILKIALISDIHGNYFSLETVLEELEAKKIERIVCLGDVAQGGPEPRRVLKKLKELSCPVVSGNADEEVLLAHSKRDYPSEIKRILHDVDRWTLDQLSEEELDFMRSFQMQITIPLAGEKSMLCFHGSPRSNTEGILPTTSEQELEQILSGIRASIMACGHTHSQMFRRYLDSIVINPGSVGLPFEFSTLKAFQEKNAYNPAWIEYAILNYENQRDVNLEMCRAPVDLEALVRSFLNSGMPHGEFLSGDWRA